MSAPFSTNSSIPRVVQTEPSPTGLSVQPVFSDRQNMTNQYTNFVSAPRLVSGTDNPVVINRMNNGISQLPTTESSPSLRSVTTIPRSTMQIGSQGSMPQSIRQPTTIVTRNSVTQPMPASNAVRINQPNLLPQPMSASNAVRINQPNLLPQPMSASNTVRINQPNLLPQPIITAVTPSTVRNTTVMLPASVPIPNRLGSSTMNRAVGMTQPFEQTVLVPTSPLIVPSQPVQSSVNMNGRRTQTGASTMLPTPVRTPTTTMLPTPVRSPTTTMLPTPVRSPTVRVPTTMLPTPVRSPTTTMLLTPVRTPTVRVPTIAPTIMLPTPVRSPTVQTMPMASTTRPRIGTTITLPPPVRSPPRMVTNVPVSPRRTTRTMPPLDVTKELEDYDDDLQQAILQSALEARQISPLPDRQEVEQLVRQTRQRPLSPMRMATRNLTQIEMDRQLREQQDMEYAAALSIDEEKARQAAEVAVLAAANAARAAENAAAAIRAVANLRAPQLLYSVQNPNDNVNIKVRYPDGNSSNYVLHRNEPLSSLIAQIKYDTRNGAGFTLTVSPGTLLMCEPNTSLNQCGIANRSVVLVNYA